MSEQNGTTNTPDVLQSPQAGQRTGANRPADTLRDGWLKATIWRNESEKGAFYTTKIAKTYEDRNGQLRDGQNFSRGDLPKIGLLANRAYERISQLEHERTHPHAHEQSQNTSQEPQSQLPVQDQTPAQNADPQRDFVQSRSQQHPPQTPQRGR